MTTCYCGIEFKPRAGAKLRCPLCAAAKPALRHGPPALDYLSQRSVKATAEVLKIPLKLVLSAEATAIAKLKVLGKGQVGETFGGRTLTPQLRAELKEFRATLQKLEEAGAAEEARAVKEILDALEASVRDITNGTVETTES